MAQSRASFTSPNIAGLRSRPKIYFSGFSTPLLGYGYLSIRRGTRIGDLVGEDAQVFGKVSFLQTLGKGNADLLLHGHSPGRESPLLVGPYQLVTYLLPKKSPKERLHNGLVLGKKGGKAACLTFKASCSALATLPSKALRFSSSSLRSMASGHLESINERLRIENNSSEHDGSYLNDVLGNLLADLVGRPLHYVLPGRNHILDLIMKSGHPFPLPPAPSRKAYSNKAQVIWRSKPEPVVSATTSGRAIKMACLVGAVGAVMVFLAPG
nr:hypothetical protein Iba_chr13eCG7550 [Ipomoea batatas]